MDLQHKTPTAAASAHSLLTVLSTCMTTYCYHSRLLHRITGSSYLGVGVVQVLFGTLVPGSIPINAVIALCIQLAPNCCREGGLFASPPLAIHVAHW